MKIFLKLSTLFLLVSCCWVSLSAQPLPCEDCLDEPFEFVCVLGDDGEIFPFPNACFAECQGYTSGDFVDCDSVIVIDDPEPCDCDFAFEPVCVTDDEGNVFTFPNECFAECEGYTSDDFTACDDNPWGNDCDCDFEFDPVCVDVDGEILPFPNACWAECEGYTDFVECDSITLPGNPCPECEDEPFEPICVETAPGIICPFPNLCYAECEGYTVDQVVECEDEPWTDCDCDFEFDPVCVDIDGEIVPFPSACWAECEGYTNFVECDSTIFNPNPCDCDFAFDPVCVTDDEGYVLTFPNACLAECEGYTVDDFTECDDNPWGNDCDCDFEFDPVCVDVDGEILPFPNACWAECEGFTDFVECDSITLPGNPCPECEDEPFEPICVETAPGIICPFPNLCTAECEGYTADQVVECEDEPWTDCDCDFEFEPVCVDVDGDILPFPNACFAECEGYTADDFVDCGDIFDPNDCGCDFVIDPVCVDIDGEILPFPNACWAECEGFTSDDFVDCDDLGNTNLPLVSGHQHVEFSYANLAQNPIRELIDLQYNSVATSDTRITIDVINLSGQSLINTSETVINGVNRIQIGAEDLDSGVYLLRIQSDKELQTIKFVK